MEKLIPGLLLLMQSSLLWAQGLMVDTDWLSNNLKQDNLVIVDMSDGMQYQRFHIPGAINLPYEYLNQNVKGVSLSIGQPQVIQLLGQLGIRQDSYVIAYDDTGGLHASRLIWELGQLGHRKMALLDGGLVSWIREGRPVSHQPPDIVATQYLPLATGQQSTATLTDVAPGKRNNKTLLIDVRSREEYIGDPRYPRSGHIPGARLWEWDQALDVDAGFTLRHHETLKQQLADVGLRDSNQPVVVYCRSGHRASHAYYTLRQLGFKNVRLYDASMKEYEKHRELPLNRGPQP